MFRVSVAGARRGPRAVVIGDVAVLERLRAEIDAKALTGTLVLLQEHNEADPSLSGAKLAIELRAGAAGWWTVPHVRGDLSQPSVARLARDSGAAIVVDRHDRSRRVPTLIFEGGEVGRNDPTVYAAAVTIIKNVLAARRMIAGERPRPPWRAVIGSIARLKAPIAGTLVPLATPGTIVPPATTLCAIHDGTREARADLTAPRRSIILAIASSTKVDAHAPVIRLGQVRSTSRRRVPHRPDARVLGWCEWIALPELAVPHLHAKIDTGARSSALHVLSMKYVGEEGGLPILEVRVPVGRGHRTVLARVVVEEWVTVRDSGGHAERRPVIQTTIVIGDVARRVRVTLTDRGEMLFPMLVGRTTLGNDFIVDASARDLLGKR